MDDDDDARAVMRQADETLSNTLDSGTCCDSSLEGLRSQIISLLSCEACQDMNFQVDNIRINGSMYRAVAYALSNPRHTLHLAYKKSISSAGTSDAAASYDPKSNRFTFTFKSIAGNEAKIAEQCDNIIHECTHACVDVAQNKVWRLSNEVAAWFAGVLFLKGQGMDYDTSIDFRANLSSLADAARKANRKRQMFVMPAAAVAALKSDIKGAYRIKNDFQETGDGFS